MTQPTRKPRSPVDPRPVTAPQSPKALRRALKETREKRDRYIGIESREEWRVAFSKDCQEANAEGKPHGLGGMRSKRRHEIDFDAHEQATITAFKARIETLEWALGLRSDL